VLHPPLRMPSCPSETLKRGGVETRGYYDIKLTILRNLITVFRT